MNIFEKFFCLFLFLLFFSNGFFANSIEDNSIIEINYFYSTGCPACASMSPFLNNLKEKYPVQINFFEISSPQNGRLFLKMLEDYSVPSSQFGRVPTVFIKEDFFIGYSSVIARDIENIILKELNDFDVNKDNNLPIKDNDFDDTVIEPTLIESNLLGIIPIGFHVSGDTFIDLLFSAIALGFVDSLNICSITVLLFLIIYLVSIGSLKRVLRTGIIFTIVIYIFYFLFMLVLSSILSLFILEYGFYIRLLIITISILVSVLLIKDFFFYGKGFSLSIPKSVKPVLEKYLKKATLGSTIIFALIASIVELPCTAIFPTIFSTILADNGITGFERISWIALYNLVYILPLLLIVFGTYFSWINIKDVDEKIQKNKKVLKLIMGLLLFLIAFYFALPLLV